MNEKVISVNVGQPRLVDWREQSVRTAIWKVPAQGRVMARRLNLDGDGQADLRGHGGENRAMLVYQLESYRYWQQLFGDTPYEMGRFGENLTVEGLADAEICVGDRFRIGEALVEVTQPRVTCYRLGIRMSRPEMPSLLVQHGRPGFYVRVLEEGTIGAGDLIEFVGSDDVRMSVAEIDRLLYLGEHPGDKLEQALSIPALSEGWKWSFRELLDAQRKGDLSGNPGLNQGAGKEQWQGFRRLLVLSNVSEAEDVRSIVLGEPSGAQLPRFEAGQHIVLKAIGADDKPLIRTYSLSGSPEGNVYRISIKREPGGTGSGYLQDCLQPGIEIDVSAPRGTFTLNTESAGPVVLLSAGIGVTPLLSILYSLTSTAREIFWIHGVRDGAHLGFRVEIDSLLSSIPNCKRLIAFSRPLDGDILGKTYDLKGRLDIEAIQKLKVPKTADFYLCGPAEFMQLFRKGLETWGVWPELVHVESFGASTIALKTNAAREKRGSHQITLSRSNRVLNWTNGSILELAEAEQVPVQWSCRVGVCHACETSLLDGDIEYSPAPLDLPSPGRILICCARPKSDLVLVL